MVTQTNIKFRFKKKPQQIYVLTEAIFRIQYPLRSDVVQIKKKNHTLFSPFSPIHCIFLSLPCRLQSDVSFYNPVLAKLH